MKLLKSIPLVLIAVGSALLVGEPALAWATPQAPNTYCRVKGLGCQSFSVINCSNPDMEEQYCRRCKNRHQDYELKDCPMGQTSPGCLLVDESCSYIQQTPCNGGLCTDQWGNTPSMCSNPANIKYFSGATACN